MSRHLFALALTGILTVSCSQGPGGPNPQPGSSSSTMQLTTIAKGADSQITQTRRVAIRDDAAWQALWREHTGTDKGRPNVDFSKDMVLATFAGERLTAGYEVTVLNVQTKGNQLQVNVREASPGPGGVSAQVLTSPFHLVRTATYPGEIVFIEAPGTPTTP